MSICDCTMQLNSNVLQTYIIHVVQGAYIIHLIDIICLLIHCWFESTIINKSYLLLLLHEKNKTIKNQLISCSLYDNYCIDLANISNDGNPWVICHILINSSCFANVH